MNQTLSLLKKLATRGPCKATAEHVLNEVLVAKEGIFDRKRMAGHITCSALVLTPDHTSVLLIHHNAYKAWLPPGGHNEAAEPLFQCAAREVEEETGVRDISPVLEDGMPLVLDLDTHPIAPRPDKDEGEHVHHDFLFLAVAREMQTPIHQESETGGARWMLLKTAEDLFLRSELGHPNHRMVRALSRLRGHLRSSGVRV